MQISILGCGWLGLPLAKTMVAEGYAIKGSTTTSGKLQLLEDAGIVPFQISLSENGITGNITAFLEGSEVLIIDVPPKLRGANGENYVEKMRKLLSCIEVSGVEKVLFVSSTSVYADDNSIITENSITNPNTESGKQLVESEQLLMGNKNFKTTILRFGGLIGPDRHPVKFMSGRDNLENPDAPVNLICLQDCIGIIKAIIQKGAWQETFNAVAPYHPTRKEYYTKKAEELGLVLPKFNHGNASVGKTIMADKILGALAYTTFLKI